MCDKPLLISTFWSRPSPLTEDSNSLNRLGSSANTSNEARFDVRKKPTSTSELPTQIAPAKETKSFFALVLVVDINYILLLLDVKDRKKKTSFINPFALENKVRIRC